MSILQCSMEELYKVQVDKSQMDGLSHAYGLLLEFSDIETKTEAVPNICDKVDCSFTQCVFL